MTNLFPSAVQSGFAASGAGFGEVLASTAYLSDADHDALPGEWRSLMALLHTLIEDEGMTALEAAKAADVPVALVVAYADAAGI